uniref:Chromosome 16 open reading frame 46 n=1 Tax=Catagonus wagneri TaxID=51154 RepID=A0A8C3YCF3_9CETA
MDLGQKNETELENDKNNEIQRTEETELVYTCPDERSEKNHVCCLLNISDITLERDEKAKEFVIGTGWEEAIQGWGRTSPTACLWPRKKLKKAKGGESASNCLLCVSLSQGSRQSGPLAEAGPEKERVSLSQTPGLPQRPTAASREVNKICFPTYSQGEKKSLQIKEFIWCLEDWAAPETVRGKGPRSPSGPSLSNSLTSKALLVLPPLKASAPNGLDDLGKKSKNFLEPEEKVLSLEKDECMTCAYGLKTVDGTGEKRPIELAKPHKVKEMQPFPTPVAPTSPLAAPQPYRLHWSVLPEKKVVCSAYPNSIRYLATLQLLQKQGAWNYKAKLGPREPRPPLKTPKRILTEAKQENRPQTLETKVFSRPLLPSLTHRKKKIK